MSQTLKKYSSRDPIPLRPCHPPTLFCSGAIWRLFFFYKYLCTHLFPDITLKKKLTENSASVTGCNRLTCKGDGKLFRHEDRVNPTSSDDKDGIFRNHRNFPAVFCSPAKEFSDNFPSTFRRMNHQK
jgi:hypothetical protein